MHRTIGDSYGLDTGKRIFRQENSPSWQATQVTYDSMNALQEEIANVIEAEGITLNTAAETIAAMTQLNTALNTKVDNALVARVPTFNGYTSPSGQQFWSDLGALTVQNIRATIQQINTPKIVFLRVWLWFDANVADYKWVAWELPSSVWRPTSLDPANNGVLPATCVLWDDSATPKQVAVPDIYVSVQRGNISSADRNVVMFGNAELMSQNPNDFPSGVSFPQTAPNDYYALTGMLMYERY